MAAAGRDEALNRLMRIADSPAVRYAERVAAARAFASAGGVLGRAPRTEIDLLRVPASLTAAAVDRPMFVDARGHAAGAAIKALKPASSLGPEVSPRGPVVVVVALLAPRSPCVGDATRPRTAGAAQSFAEWAVTAADRARFARESGTAHQQIDRRRGGAISHRRPDGEPTATAPRSDSGSRRSTMRSPAG
jgi:hypothetical protein